MTRISRFSCETRMKMSLVRGAEATFRCFVKHSMGLRHVSATAPFIGTRSVHRRFTILYKKNPGKRRKGFEKIRDLWYNNITDENKLIRAWNAADLHIEYYAAVSRFWARTEQRGQTKHMKNWFIDNLTFIWQQLRDIGLIDILDIGLVSIVLFFAYKFIRERRAGKLALGVVLLFLIMICISQCIITESLGNHGHTHQGVEKKKH